MKAPIKRRVRALKAKAIKAVTRGRGFVSYKLKLQAQMIARLSKECAQ